MLRGLARTRAVVTAHLSGTKEFAVTAVLEVDVQTATVILDPSANPELNRRLLASTPIRFISNEEGVRVQFQASRIESVTFQGRPALRIALPASLHKVQRREYYRMSTPIMNPVKCMIPAAGDEALEMPLTDISLGGLCLAGEFGNAPPALGTVLEGCRIQLATVGALRIDLYVRNTYLVTLRNGSYSAARLPVPRHHRSRKHWCSASFFWNSSSGAPRAAAGPLKTTAWSGCGLHGARNPHQRRNHCAASSAK